MSCLYSPFAVPAYSHLPSSFCGVHVLESNSSCLRPLKFLHSHSLSSTVFVSAYDYILRSYILTELRTEVDGEVGFLESSVDVEILFIDLPGPASTVRESQEAHYPGSQHLSSSLTQFLTVLSLE